MTSFKEYKIITGFEGSEKFEVAINAAINEGWQPIGGVNCTVMHTANVGTTVQYNVVFHQSMVK